MRLALFSPFNPERSGISDYMEELLPALAEHAEIDLVTRGYSPTTPFVRANFRALNPQQFLASRDRYEAVVYQIGNHLDFHGYMLPCMKEVPGVVLLHDYSLGYLMLGLTLARGDFASLVRMLEPEFGATAATVARQALLGQIDPYRLPLVRPIVEMSTGILVHNRFTRDKLLARYPDHPVEVVWHATPTRETLPDSAAIRRKYGIPERDFVIVSVSRLGVNKRLDLAIGAIGDLVKSVPEARLIIVGEGNLGTEAESLIDRLQLSKYITRTGWVSAEQYLDYIDLADAAVDLRTSGSGETSGGSLRLLQAGKPVVATEQGFFLELPSDCCIRIPSSAPNEKQAVVQALGQLAASPELRSKIGGAARQFALNHLKHSDAAAGYIRFIKGLDAAKRTTTPWSLPHRRGAASELPVRALFQAARLAQYSRKYGMAAAFRRVVGHSNAAPVNDNRKTQIGGGGR